VDPATQHPNQSMETVGSTPGTQQEAVGITPGIQQEAVGITPGIQQEAVGSTLETLAADTDLFLPQSTSHAAAAGGAVVHMEEGAV